MNFEQPSSGPEYKPAVEKTEKQKKNPRPGLMKKIATLSALVGAFAAGKASYVDADSSPQPETFTSNVDDENAAPEKKSRGS